MTPLRLAGEDGDPLERRPERGPRRGEHTAAVLQELCGYAPERIDELAAAGVFGVDSDTIGPLEPGRRTGT